MGTDGSGPDPRITETVSARDNFFFLRNYVSMTTNMSVLAHSNKVKVSCETCGGWWSNGWWAHEELLQPVGE